MICSLIRVSLPNLYLQDNFKKRIDCRPLWLFLIECIIGLLRSFYLESQLQSNLSRTCIQREKPGSFYFISTLFDQQTKGRIIHVWNQQHKRGRRERHRERERETQRERERERERKLAFCFRNSALVGNVMQRVNPSWNEYEAPLLHYHRLNARPSFSDLTTLAPWCLSPRGLFFLVAADSSFQIK